MPEAIALPLLQVDKDISPKQGSPPPPKAAGIQELGKKL